MRVGLAALLLAACGGPRTGPAKIEVADAPVDAAPRALIEPETPPSDSPVDWSKATWSTDDEAMVLWAEMGLTGDNYQLLLGDIPAEPAEAMAKALLRQGGFAGCATTKIQISCEQTEEEFLAVEPAATMTDPCLRRRLALWSLDHLDDRTLSHEMIADVVALAALPAPEDELNRAVLYRISDEPTRLQMIEAAVRAGNTALADEAISGLSVASLEAAAALHLDSAVDSLDGSSTKALGDAVLDPLLKRETRIRAVRDLGYWVLDTDPLEASRELAADAVRAAAKADDCAVAGAAAYAATAFDDKPFPPPLPKNAKPAAVMRQICEVISGGGDEYGLWAELIGEGGVTVRHVVHDPARVAMLWEDNPDAVDANKDGAPDVDDADPDGDGDPATTHDVVHFDAEQWLSDGTYLDEIRRVLPECKGTKCYLSATRTDFTFHFRKGKKSQVLESIDIEESTAGC